jgi:hypothetical protein
MGFNTERIKEEPKIFYTSSGNRKPMSKAREDAEALFPKKQQNINNVEMSDNERAA